nr:hypothetical protein [Tanacetum cinerariifolium]
MVVVVREFVPDITSAPAKRLKSSVKGIGGSSNVSKKSTAKKGFLVIKHPASIALESDVGSPYDIFDDLASFEAGFRHVVSSKEFNKATTYLSSTSTRLQLMVPICSSTPSSPKSRHILGIIIAIIEVCDQANVAATHHITLFFEIRLWLEHSDHMREKLERMVECQDAVIC